MGQGFVQTCPGPRLGKFTNSSSKWNVWATQEEIWRFLAAAWGEVCVGEGCGGCTRTMVSAHPPPHTGRKPKEGAHDSQALKGSSDTAGTPQPLPERGSPSNPQAWLWKYHRAQSEKEKSLHTGRSPLPGNSLQPITRNRNRSPAPPAPPPALPGPEAPASLEGAVGAGSPSAAPKGFTGGLGWAGLIQEPSVPRSTPRNASSNLSSIVSVTFAGSNAIAPTPLASPPCSPSLCSQDWLKGEARDCVSVGGGGGGDEEKREGDRAGLLQNQEAKGFPGLLSTLQAFSHQHLKPATPAPRPSYSHFPGKSTMKPQGKGAPSSGTPRSQMLRSDPRCAQGPAW